MIEELKPCPFCGGNASVNEGEFEGSKVFSVSCEKCGATTGGADNVQIVIDVWNKRTELQAAEEVLKPCPYCGGEATTCEVDVEGQRVFSVVCVECGVSTFGSDNEAEVVGAWNRRVL